MQLRPDPALAPARKPREDAVPTTQFRRQQAPLRTATQHPQHGVQKLAARLGPSYVHPWMRHQKGPDRHPLLIGQSYTNHHPAQKIAINTGRAIKCQQNLGQRTGTAIPGLNGEKLRRLSLPEIPLPEQHRLITELDTLQAQVDALKRLQAET